MIVIGVGNEWRGDDAAGLEVVRRLRRRRPQGARLVQVEDEPSRLLDEWSGESEAVVIDAVRADRGPGTIHRVDVSSGRLPELRGPSTHHLGLAEAVELGRALGRLPERLELIGVEGGSFAAGRGLRPEVERAVQQLTDELAQRLALAARS